MGHVLHKNSLEKKKALTTFNSLIKCIKKLRFFFATMTVGKLRVFKIYNRTYL